MEIKMHRTGSALVSIAVSDAPTTARAVAVAHRIAADWLDALTNTDPGAPIFDGVYYSMPTVVTFDTHQRTAEVRIVAGNTSRSLSGVSLAAQFVVDNFQV